MKREQSRENCIAGSLLALFLAAGFTTTATAQKAIELGNEQVEKIVCCSCPYVALYNVNNKFALDDSAPTYTGGWNKIVAKTTLADHTFRFLNVPGRPGRVLSRVTGGAVGGRRLRSRIASQDDPNSEMWIQKPLGKGERYAETT